MFRHLVNLCVSDKVVCVIKKLYPGWEVGRKLYEYYVQKFKLSLLILIAGIFISMAVYFAGGKSTFDENLRIKRNDYGGGDKNVSVNICTKNGTYNEDVDIKIPEKKYSEAEIKKLADECVGELYKNILAENESFDNVIYNLNFIKELPGYPFTISYSTSRPLILSSDGVINLERLNHNDDISSGIDVNVTVTLSYYEFKREDLFCVCIYERPLTEYEQIDRNIRNAIDQNNEKTSTEDYFLLPSQVDGIELTFDEEKDFTPQILFFISMIVSVVIFLAKDKELEKEFENRNKELEKLYPNLISRFVLFYNAGIPVKNIWMIICDDYIKKRNQTGIKTYLFEEMIITRAQILDGKSEIDSYEDFARRINLPRYRVFISLIEQAVTMGKRDLSITLRRESDNAFTERKNNAKKMLEEASTKLLAPMFMMLLVVIIILMFPAFYSFKM